MVGSMSRRIFCDRSWSRYFGPLMMTTILLTIMSIIFVPGALASDAPDTETQSGQSERTNPLSRDAIFMGSATILGLATFGSLLTVMMGPIHAYSKNLTRAVFGGLAVIVALSTSLMFFACCLKPLNPFELGIYMVVIGSVAYIIITIFAFVIEKRFTNSSSSTGP